MPTVGQFRELTSIDGDCVTAPHVFWVDVCEANVLDDDVLCVADDSNTFAFDHAFDALADQTLVGSDGHAQDTGFVVCDLADFGSIRLVVDTPIILIDRKLACGSGTPGSAARVGRGALGAGEVESLGKDDDAGRRVLEVADKLSIGGWVDWRSTAAAGDT